VTVGVSTVQEGETIEESLISSKQTTVEFPQQKKCRTQNHFNFAPGLVLSQGS